MGSGGADVQDPRQGHQQQRRAGHGVGFNFLTDPMTVKVKETIIETFPVVVSSKLRHGLYVSEGLQEGHDGP